MVQMPAFCTRCGTAFPSGFDFRGGVYDVSGNLSGPCPRCGAMGRVPDGVFNFIGNTIEIVSAPERTVEDLRRLAGILQEAGRFDRPLAEVSERIKREVPPFAALADLLPKDRAELYAFLALILATIQIVQAFRSVPVAHAASDSRATAKITVERVLEEVMRGPSSPTQAARASTRIRLSLETDDPALASGLFGASVELGSGSRTPLPGSAELVLDAPPTRTASGNLVFEFSLACASGIVATLVGQWLHDKLKTRQGVTLRIEGTVVEVDEKEIVRALSSSATARTP